MLKEFTKIKIIDSDNNPSWLCGHYATIVYHIPIGIYVNKCDFKGNFFKIKLDNGEYWLISRESDYEIIDDSGLDDTYEEKTINLIDTILTRMGLKLGEEFEIKENDKWKNFIFKSDGIYHNINCRCHMTFNDLISGKIPYRKIKPIPKPTEEEQEYLDAAKKLGFNWVAKDENDQIYFYEFKPIKNDYCWYRLSENKENENYGECLESKINFKFLSWEDEEPYEIK